MPQFKHDETGRLITVSGAELEAQYATDTAWSLVPEKPARKPKADAANEN